MNRRGVLGYYLQVKCGNQWAKISVSHADRHSDRVTVDELDDIDPSCLQPALVIPTESISSALRSGDADRASVHEYTNRSAVEGIWAEFYHKGNWYMISISHVDCPARASSEDLESIADNLLRQQGQGPRRRWVASGQN